MAVTRKVKGLLEWIEHGYFIVQLLISGSVGTFVRSILLSFTHIPNIWVTPISLCSAALALWGVIKGWNYSARNKQPQQLQSTTIKTTPLVKSEIDLSLSLGTYKDLDYRLTEETQRHLAISLEPYTDRDRETVLKEIAIAWMWSFLFYFAWSLIYGSQIRAMNELNRRMLKREEIHFFYAEAVRAYPAVYATYTFEQWLGFLRTWHFIIEDADRIGITVRGQGFLKFMLSASQSDKDRLY